MKEYAQKLQNQSHIICKQSKILQQKSLNEVLQQYNENTRLYASQLEGGIKQENVESKFVDVEFASNKNEISNSLLQKVDKEKFLIELKDVVFKVADEILLQIHQTANDCPYICKWFNYYANQDISHIEKAIARFAPETIHCSSLEQYMGKIAERVRIGLQNHVRTGTMEDIPPEIIEENHKPQDFFHIAQKIRSVTQLSRLDKKQTKADIEMQSLTDIPHYKDSDSKQTEHTPDPDGTDTAGYEDPDDKKETKEKQPSSINQDQTDITPYKDKDNKEAIPRKIVGQGETCIAYYGGEVENTYTTSCGLVLGLGKERIMCYHWPFMDKEYHEVFNKKVKEVKPLKNIVVITNDFPKGDSINDYIDTVRKIATDHPVPLTYYVIDKQNTGSIHVKIEEDGKITSLGGTFKTIDF